MWPDKASLNIQTHGSVPGLLAPDSFSNFIFPFFFFSFSDRPNQNQKTHSTINEKKRGWPKLASKET